MNFLRLFEADPLDIAGLKNYLQEFVRPFTGRLAHGAFMTKLYSELTSGYFWSDIAELGEHESSELFSTSLSEETAFHFFSDDSGVVFEAENLQVLRVPEWLVGLLSKETGADWYRENEAEIATMAAKFGIPADRFYSTEFALPPGFLTDHIQAEAYTMFTEGDFSSAGGNQEDEVSVCWARAQGKLRVVEVRVRGEVFTTARDAVAHMEGSFTQDDLEDSGDW